MPQLRRLRPGDAFEPIDWNRMVDEINRLRKLSVVEPLEFADDPAGPAISLGGQFASAVVTWIRLDENNPDWPSAYNVTIVRPDPDDPYNWLVGTPPQTAVAYEANGNDGVPVAPAPAYYPAWKYGDHIRFQASSCTT